jgi:dTMP kinase
MMRGALICIESCDGGGSTTQRDRLVATLDSRGIAACGTAQPSPGPIGQLIRDVLNHRAPERLDGEAFQRLFVADRVDHLARLVEPDRAKGYTVICDRGELSTVIYYAAGATTNQAEIERASEAFRWHRSIAIPTLTIVLTVPDHVAAARRLERGGPAELFEVASFQERVARLYCEPFDLVMNDARGRYLAKNRTENASLVAIDGTGTIDEVAARVMECVDYRIDLAAQSQ